MTSNYVSGSILWWFHDICTLFLLQTPKKSSKSVKKVNIPTSNLFSCTISPLLPPPNEEIITLGLLPMLEKIKKAKPAKISFNIHSFPHPKLLQSGGAEQKKILSKQNCKVIFFSELIISKNNQKLKETNFKKTTRIDFEKKFCCISPSCLWITKLVFAQASNFLKFLNLFGKCQLLIQEIRTNLGDTSLSFCAFLKFQLSRWPQWWCFQPRQPPFEAEAVGGLN